MIEFTLAISFVLALLGAAAAAYVVRSRRANAVQAERAQRAQTANRHIPPSLHPVIDPDICIGSAACVAACPEGDILGLVNGAGKLILGAACVGHGRCAAECPVDAIKLVFGTAERGVDIPHVTSSYETNRTGIYIAGELGGMGLIRNAVRQGVAAARHAVANVKLVAGAAASYDVLVVGAGPAGIGAGLACEEAGAKYVIIEQNQLGGAAASYPRQKIVMSEPVEVPLFGRIHKPEMSKSELLAIWQRIADETRLVVQTDTKLTGIAGEDGAFTVSTTKGDFTARKVVLAIGRRGTPRKIGCPGEEGTNVTYELIETHQYKDSEVVVVGGGDSALEAACTLVEEANAKVHLVHRSESFRANEKNVQRLYRMRDEGRITLHLEAAVSGIEAHCVHIKGKAGVVAVPALWTVVLVGGELPTPLLQGIGIRFDRWFGKAPTTGPEVKIEVRKVSLFDTWVATVLLGLGVLGLGYLAWIGRDYYGLDATARAAAQDHASLRASGNWGHGIGIFATLVMLTNFTYAARKRIKALRKVGILKTWLNVHAVVGGLTPLYIAFHAAFTANNFYAILSYYAVGAVVSTGIIGRYIYGRLQSPKGQADGRVGGLKKFMRNWRIIHVILALLMVVAIVIHIGVSLLFGYKWLWS